ncbi:MAG: phosphate ABC transporter substrate-binding protein [Elusimicrobiota bacterium]|jgi:phosphate transport system substrate-binding protein|nr:phosphate ABC transporter substrate-binding protein [Elusimicrobiota bacterium]
MKNKYFLIFLLLIFIFVSCQRRKETTNSSDSIQIKGSDTIVNLVQVWAEKFVDGKNEISIGVTGGGSGTGFAALINKTCDIAMSSRKIEVEETNLAMDGAVFPFEFVVGYDGLAVLVNKNNPVEELTMAQLRDIFTGKITNWKELGGDDLKIVILSRESNSGTHMFFKEQVLRLGNVNAKDEFSPRSLLMPSSTAIFDEIEQNPHTIGYVGMGFASDLVKTIKVAQTKGQESVLPTVDNVLSWKYPISRPLYLYTDGDPKGLVKDFIDYALSDKGQKIVEETFFVPIKKGK